MDNFTSNTSRSFSRENNQKQLSQPVDFDHNDHDHTQNSGSVPLEKLVEQFPDISLYIYHGAFPFFANTWVDFQKVMILAKNPLNRLEAQTWLRRSALTIHSVLACIVKSSNMNMNLESQARVIFSALRKLKDRMEIMHQVIQIIENGRVLNQSPIEAIKPIRDASKRIKAEVKRILSSDFKYDATNKQDEFQAFYNQFMNLNLDDVPNTILNTYHLIPYHLQEIDFEQMNTPNKINQYEHSVTPSTNFKQSDSYMTTGSKKMVKSSRNKGRQNELIWIQEYIPVDTAHVSNQSKSQIKTLNETDNASNKYSSIVASRYNSNSILRPFGTNKTEFGGISSKNTSATSTPSEIEPHELVAENQYDEDQESNVKTDDDDDYIQQEEGIEDDNISLEELPNITLKKLKTKNIMYKRSPATRSRRSVISRTEENKKRGIYQVRTTRRTATSYDSATTHYLKSVFFDIYSHKDKLNKEQRKQVQVQTGLKPRNITYWFSNHKRRFRHSLIIYRKAMQENQGIIKNYEDFVNWRKSNGLPEEVMDWET